MPRPTALTPERHARVVTLAAHGNSKTQCAALAGIHRDTIYEWLARGEARDAPKADEPFVEFALAFRAAEARWARRMRRRLLADPKSVPAITFLLKHRFPGEYGDRQVIEHQGSEERPVRHVVDVTSDDLLLALDAFASGLATAHDGPGDAGAGARDADPGAAGEPRG